MPVSTKRRPRWERLLRGVSLRSIAPHPPAAPSRDPARLVARALNEGCFESFLSELAGRGPITLVVNDPHRVPPAGAILPALIARADAAGMKRGWRLLVATGSHRFDQATRTDHEERILGKLGRRFEARLWHDAFDPDALAPLGSCRLHRWIVEGAGAIAIGSTEPHYFAGVTGAHKTLTIGLMGIDDLRDNHKAAMLEGADLLRTAGNPVFEGIAAVITALEDSGRRLFALNQLYFGNRLAGCLAGRPLEILERALPAVRSMFVHAIPTPLDLLVAVVSSPLDRTFYQADKGIKNVEAAVRKGGVLLLDAACPEGIGIDRFLGILRRANDESGTLAQIRQQGYQLGDHKAVRLRRLTDSRGVRIGIISRDIPPSTARLLHVVAHPDREAAAAWALEQLAGGATPGGLIVNDAGNVCIRVRAGSGEG